MENLVEWEVMADLWGDGLGGGQYALRIMMKKVIGILIVDTFKSVCLVSISTVYLRLHEPPKNNLGCNA